MTTEPTVALPRTSRDETVIPIPSIIKNLFTTPKPTRFEATPNDWRPASSATTWAYPAAPGSRGVTETLAGGVVVKDPWRALEDLELPETQRFIEEQNDLVLPYLQNHPSRGALEASLDRSLAYERSSGPERQGDGYYYWLYNDGESPRDVFVRSKDLARDFGRRPVEGGKGGPELVFDPSAEEGISLYMYSWSPSGRYFNTILQKAGSDWQRIRTYDMQTMRPVEADLGRAKFTFGACWVGEHGYMYKALIPPPGTPLDALNSTEDPVAGPDGKFGIYYHTLNTPQSEDTLVWQMRGSTFVGRPHVWSADEREGSGRRRWISMDIYASTSPQTEVIVVEMPSEEQMRGKEGEWGQELQRLFENEGRWANKGYEGDLIYVGTRDDDTHIFTQSTHDEPAGRVITLPASTFDASAPESVLETSVLVPPSAESHKLRSAHMLGPSTLMLIYLQHACAAVVFVDAFTGRELGSTDPSGTRGEIDTHGADGVPLPVPARSIPATHDGAVLIPKHASVSAVACRGDSPDFYISVDTFVAQPYVLRGQVLAPKVEGHDREIDISRLSPASSSTSSVQGQTHAPDDLVCTQVFYPSHDGTKIPMFICHAADLDVSQPQPVLLSAYGGFAASAVPRYDPLYDGFMRSLRGIVAVACIRGGGEYGSPWHEAAMGTKRWVAWDDFAAAASYLHKEGWSTPALTSSYGTSNGGLLVAAAAERHPELWSAVCPDVPVTDLVRFHLFTLGRVWMAEYGNPEDPAVLPLIHKLSPLHNVDPSPAKEYPAIMITTADHDTRVIPGHGLKLTAELQDKKRGNRKPFFARIYKNAGHESGSKTTQQKVDEIADRLIFILSFLRFPSQ